MLSASEIVNSALEKASVTHTLREYTVYFVGRCASLRDVSVHVSRALEFELNGATPVASVRETSSTVNGPRTSSSKERSIDACLTVRSVCTSRQIAFGPVN